MGSPMKGDGLTSMRCLIKSLLALASALAPLPAGSHTNNSGRSCCDGSECRPAHYRFHGSDVEMLITGAWIYVPKGTVQFVASPATLGTPQADTGAASPSRVGSSPIARLSLQTLPIWSEIGRHRGTYPCISGPPGCRWPSPRRARRIDATDGAL